MEKVFKALADPTRRRILQLLRTRAMSAGEIADRFTLAKATLSGHFAILRAADLIDAERRGSTIIYRLNLSVLQEALLEFAEAFGIGRDGSRIRRRSGEAAG
ncbi:MAG TPA: autorepressor SdpR family transcription factor [Steroidobacteraceae bacterium]|jgi:DNA-binding transcriptional ArsR family regulator|nr:autorepressor SdpR family transcription factor [Steroidobacteraceae bacterium]